MTRANNFLDLTGRKFGMLVVRSLDETHTIKHVIKWNCVCDCGGTASVRSVLLRKGGTKSCGCLKLAQQKRLGPDSVKHGKRNTPEYRVWADMRRRCDTPSQTSYKNYGGRGIRVCPAWDMSFVTFLADMGERPSPTHSIDRIDPNGDYEPGNCRWATAAEQAVNKSRVLRVVWKGETIPLCVLARQLGKNQKVLHGRVKAGWDLERALSEPVHHKKQLITMPEFATEARG